MGDVTDFRGGKSESELAVITGNVEAAWMAASDIQSSVTHAASILEVFADAPSQTVEGDDGSEAWLRVEYAARQIRRHAQDLAAELEKIEMGVMALQRLAEASSKPPSPVEDGGAA
jgi:hypothetical protein